MAEDDLLDEYVRQQIDTHICGIVALKYRTSVTSVRKMITAYIEHYDPMYLTIKHQQKADMDDTTIVRINMDAALRDAKVFDKELRAAFGDLVYDYLVLAGMKKIERMSLER